MTTALKHVTKCEFEKQLAVFPQIRLDLAQPNNIAKIISHLNKGQVKICECDGPVYCKTEYAVIDVIYRIHRKMTLHLVEKVRNKDRPTSRPSDGINTKIAHGENETHAAHRALRHKLGISRFDGLRFVSIYSDVLRNGTGIPGLFTKNVLHLFQFDMCEQMYNPMGYIFGKSTHKETLFEWAPVNNHILQERQLLP